MNYSYRIVDDNDLDDPRTWDTLTVIVMKHRKFSFPNEINFDFNECDSWGEVHAKLQRSRDYCAILPIYMFDHSGISLSTADFNDRWDSGQVGFICMKRKEFLSAFGFKHMSKKRLEMAEEYMRDDVAVYGKYINGEGYGFEVYDEDGTVVDSCYGYYDKAYAEDEAVSVIKYFESKEEV